jgi:hypothetical protein
LLLIPSIHTSHEPANSGFLFADANGGSIPVTGIEISRIWPKNMPVGPELRLSSGWRRVKTS